MLDSSFVESVGPFSVQRVPSGPGAKVKDEAVVIFRTVDVRDAIKRAARNLAGKGPSFGIRLEVPNNMKSAMGALQSASYEIRQKFPDARTNVLFDDEQMGLVLDFCTSDGGVWRRMSAGQARERKKKKPRSDAGRTDLDDGELDELLDGLSDSCRGEQGAGP